jgi:hypothetical protein
MNTDRQFEEEGPTGRWREERVWFRWGPRGLRQRRLRRYVRGASMNCKADYIHYVKEMISSEMWFANPGRVL